MCIQQRSKRVGKHVVHAAPRIPAASHKASHKAMHIAVETVDSDNGGSGSGSGSATAAEATTLTLTACVANGVACVSSCAVSLAS